MSETLSDLTGNLAPETVSVQGLTFNVKEFDMRTRALWMNVSKEYGLQQRGHELQTKIIPRLSGLSFDVENDARVKSANARLEALQKKHDTLLEVYATPDEPEDIEEQLEAIVLRMEGQEDKLREVIEAVQVEIGGQASDAEEMVAEFMEQQDKAHIDFVWRLARAMGKTELDFDEFYGRCNGSDYEAAERFVAEGNAQWASLYKNRMQQKPSSKSLN